MRAVFCSKSIFCRSSIGFNRVFVRNYANIKDKNQNNEKTDKFNEETEGEEIVDSIGDIGMENQDTKAETNVKIPSFSEYESEEVRDEYAYSSLSSEYEDDDVVLPADVPENDLYGKFAQIINPESIYGYTRNKKPSYFASQWKLAKLDPTNEYKTQGIPIGSSIYDTDALVDKTKHFIDLQKSIVRKRKEFEEYIDYLLAESKRATEPQLNPNVSVWDDAMKDGSFLSPYPFFLFFPFSFFLFFSFFFSCFFIFSSKNKNVTSFLLGHPSRSRPGFGDVKSLYYCDFI